MVGVYHHTWKFARTGYIPVWSPQAPGLPRKFSEIMRVQHLAGRQAYAAPTSSRMNFSGLCSVYLLRTFSHFHL